MSLQLALNNALTSLKVNQQTLAVISNNIANANTVGYSRQVVDLASVAVDGVGQGVRVEDVVRKVDMYLQRAITTQTANVGKSAVINDYYERAQVMLGEPGAENSIDEHIEIFFNALQSMADAPERTSTRAAVVEAGITLANELRTLSEGIYNARFEADQEIAQSVKEINAQLKQLAHLNDAIASAKSVGSPTPTLLDERDRAVKKIAEFMDVTVHERESGEISLYGAGGVTLLDSSLFELSYKKLNSVQGLMDGDALGAIQVHQIDPTGNRIGQAIELSSAAPSEQVVNRVNSGKLSGLLQVRDKIMPAVQDQLDQLAGTLRDTFNAIHNDGSGYPAASELTGTRMMRATEKSLWSGKVMIAALGKDGTPVDSAFTSEGAQRPLTIDLSKLDAGRGPGMVDMQSVIDEINNHYGTPQNKLSLGNLNQVQLALTTDKLNAISPSFSFDFDIENISGGRGDFWVNGVTVLDDTGTDISNVSAPLPEVALDAANTFVTTAGSNQVTINTVGVHTLKVGDRIKLTDPGVAVGGIPGTAFDGYVTIDSVTSNGFTVTLGVAATTSTTTGVAGQVATPPASTTLPGDHTRSGGKITANTSGNPTSSYYDVQVQMAVMDKDGVMSTTTATYRVHNDQANMRNDRISARSVAPGGDGVVEIPTTTRGTLKAILVDEKGVELPHNDGNYSDYPGFLKIISLDPDVTIAIDQLDSQQLGRPTDTPKVEPSNRGFSHFFELNNFFASNKPSATGDTMRNAALNMKVEDRLQKNPSLLSTGGLKRSSQPSDSSLPPVFTYERYSGDQSIAQRLAGAGSERIQFASAGGLPDTVLSFNGYSGEMLGYFASLTVSATATQKDDLTLLKGYTERSDAFSGVNLDEELANTIIYQNAYAASARVVSITNELFDTLLQM